MTLLEELHRQVKEELKDIESSLEASALKQMEIMMYQKFGIMQALLTEEELSICLGGIV